MHEERFLLEVFVSSLPEGARDWRLGCFRIRTRWPLKNQKTKSNIYGSNVVTVAGDIRNSPISQVQSSAKYDVTPEMWQQLRDIANKYGKSGEPALVDQLKTLVDQGKRAEAKPVWAAIKSFLSVFGNVAQLVSTFDSFLH